MTKVEVRNVNIFKHNVLFGNLEERKGYNNFLILCERLQVVPAHVLLVL